MSTGAVLALAAVLVIAAVIAAFTLIHDSGGGRLRRRFGPEYERTLARHDGDDRATREELTERVRKYGALERRPLDPGSRERYELRWQAVQGRFVDEPAAAVGEADRLIGGLAAERGFPAAGSDEHFDALSVHHPHPVQGYRQAHALADHAGAGGRRATEDLRRALVAARGLFDELLGSAAGTAGIAATSEPAGASDAAARTRPEPSRGTDADAGSDAGADGSADRDDADPHGFTDPEAAQDGDARPRRTPLAARFAPLAAARKPR
ncbi:hypothetical protein V2S66_17360 [Streptomyces sp. V4-01]|uniref:Secreted protein n=1 Tax=Actinacidiphila polyblastidii TaxID=3110430 RepID=A0ABU7PD64_9ACTN|nr:hypothetical protein [Streptomyces sp. V4-01]